MVKEKKQRITRQRKVILEELRKVTSHPTADEIYQMVKKRLPKISLGTVYRNLEVLSESGEIQKIDVDENRLRYDGNPKEHYHIKCIKCGRVDDLHDLPDLKMEKKAGRITNWEITGHRLDFFGICPACLKAGRKR
jgi:Fur family ferric uptake transcriptional regulator